MKATVPTQRWLLENFVYNRSNGRLTFVGSNGTKPHWTLSGSQKRYLKTTLFGRNYYLHHLVWLFFRGYLPKMIDHINLDPKDCRIENLRECTSSQNQYNTRKRGHNTSGFKGVVFYPYGFKNWHAKIVVDGKTRSLGYYKTKEEAAEAYQRAAKEIAGTFFRY